MVSTRSVAVAPSGRSPGELEADHARDQHRDRLAEHGRLGLDAADAPADHAEAVDHRGVRVGADAGVGVGRAPPTVRAKTTRARCSMLTWCTMPVPGGTTLKSSNARLAPAQELVALAVAPVLDLDVALEGVGAAEDVGDHRVVDDQLGRGQRVDPGRVAAEVGHRLAHGGQVDDAGHAGEVLHDHPRRGELDLACPARRRVPAARARMWSAVMFAPSSVRSRFSSRTSGCTGRRLARPRRRPAGRSRSELSPDRQRALAPKLSVLLASAIVRTPWSSAGRPNHPAAANGCPIGARAPLSRRQVSRCQEISARGPVWLAGPVQVSVTSRGSRRVRSDLVRSDPVRSDPVRSDRARSDLVRSDLVRPVPARLGPGRWRRSAGARRTPRGGSSGTGRRRACRSAG